MESETHGNFLDADAYLPSGLNGLHAMLLSVEVSKSELENIVSSKLKNLPDVFQNRESIERNFN